MCIRDSYYHSQILPARLARQNKTAEELNQISVEGVDEATMRAIRSAALDLAASPSCDPKALNSLVGLILKAEQLAQDKRRLKILEAKAAQADAAKQVTQSTLTPEERDRDVYKRQYQWLPMLSAPCRRGQPAAVCLRQS